MSHTCRLVHAIHLSPAILHLSVPLQGWGPCPGPSMRRSIRCKCAALPPVSQHSCAFFLSAPAWLLLSQLACLAQHPCLPAPGCARLVDAASQLVNIA